MVSTSIPTALGAAILHVALAAWEEDCFSGIPESPQTVMCLFIGLRVSHFAVKELRHREINYSMCEVVLEVCGKGWMCQLDVPFWPSVLFPSPDKAYSSFVVKEITASIYTCSVIISTSCCCFSNQHKECSDPCCVLPWFLNCAKRIPMVCFPCFLALLWNLDNLHFFSAGPSREPVPLSHCIHICFSFWGI